jgi:hypothetical protein
LEGVPAVLPMLAVPPGAAALGALRARLPRVNAGTFGSLTASQLSSLR